MHDGRWLRVAVWLRVRRWSDWLLLVAAHLLHGLLLRTLTAPAVLSKWANASQRVLWVPVLGISLGAAEDALVCAFALALYRLLDACCGPAKRARAVTAAGLPLPHAPLNGGGMSASSASVADSLRFAGYALVFVLSNAFFTADAVLVRTRQLRASADLLAMYLRERDAVDELQVDAQELRVLHEHVALTAAFALMVGFFGAVWSDLTEWDVLRALQRFRVRRLGWRPPIQPQQYLQVPQHVDDCNSDSHSVEDGAGTKPSSRDDATAIAPQRWVDRMSTRTLLVLLVAAFGASTIALSQLVPSIVAMVALNASLNEPLRLLLGLELYAIRHAAVPPGRRMADFVEHETEDAEMFSHDALFRRTRGFKGPLAFNVSIRAGEQLNVLVVVVESFRQRDSRYLLQEDAFAQLGFPAEMPSLTPQFDKWARRGVGFRNMWSSWRTSRALESILFGQVPYDSVASTGTTGGRPDVALSGLPQLFKAKGYECIFTAGSRADYEDWDAFLPAHGFDHVLDTDTLVDIATDEVGIDVTEGEQLMTYWGVHDHVSFDVLGYLLQKQQAEQQNGSIHNVHAERDPSRPRWSDRLDTTKPWFITHFTISSHVPFDERPEWYHRYSHEIPDFSAFYRRDGGRDEHEELLRNYAEMRYFTDLTFGHFMDNLNKSGVLNNTLVFVTGDHGQAPERGSATPEQDQMAATRVAGALIAEGRLGDSAGLLFDDVASHADLLNTLADIVGIPADGAGFLQSGVGHSLKRAVPFGRRVVHSNNPAVSMAAVQGHTRMEYYTEFSDVVRAFDTERDPFQMRDLMGELSSERAQRVLEICAEGRMVSDYFKQRWDNACILVPTC
ncbi:hypothetical protein PybrP1_011945 [[Pythium] brassicae (nom. inval.)]|nr:hypothetical protein PybrP1_011945 [[Pythium] brassicae (nom. inval.)]